jgi:hypothetical protein
MARLGNTLLVIALGLSLAGCSKGTQFDSEAEELAYLSSLSNPTPEQWKRKNALTIKVAQEIEARESKQLAAWNDPAAVAQRAKEDAERKKQADDREIMLLMGKGFEKQQNGDPGGACFFFRTVAEKFPNAPEAKTARERLRICRKLAYGVDDDQ